MAKKVTAPKTYNPGGGHPREHLAYLNQREMDYLRSINGGNTSRGPKGLPSFVETSGTKSAGSISDSYKGTGGGFNSSTGSRSASGSTSVGQGQGGQRGAGSNTGPGSGRPGTSSSSGNSQVGQGGQSAQRGAGSNYGAGSGRPGTTSSVGGSKGPSSPMGGQGPSFSRDTQAQQMSQVRDAIAAVKNTPAFRGDAVSGGIRTINVGPVGTPVSVGKTSLPPGFGTISGSVAKARPSTSISSQFPSYKYDRPLTPGVTPEDMARRGAMMQEIEDSIRRDNLMNKTTVTPTGNPIQAGGIAPPANPIQGTGYGTFHVPNVKDLGIAGLAAALPEFKVPEKIDPNDVYGPTQEHILSIEDVPDLNETSVKKTEPGYVGSYSGPSFNQESDLQRAAVDKAIAESVMNASLSGEPVTATTTTPSAFRQGRGPWGIARDKGITSYNPGDYDAYRSGAVSDGATTSPSQEPLSEDLAKNVDPVTGQAAYPEDNWGMKIAKHAGIVGKAVQLADWASRKNFSKMSPAEQAAEMGRWAKNREEYRRNGAKENDRGEEPMRPPGKKRESTTGTKAPEAPAGRPYKYYEWDAGVNIPSPSDSDYTLYQKYLEEKAAARAAV